MTSKGETRGISHAAIPLISFMLYFTLSDDNLNEILSLLLFSEVVHAYKRDLDISWGW